MNYPKFMILTGVVLLMLSAARAQIPKSEKMQVFYVAVRDTLSNKKVKNVALGRYNPAIPLDSAGKMTTISHSKKDTAKNWKKRITDFIAVLKDSSNYLRPDLVRSCSFVPEYYFRLILGNKQMVYVLFSATCEQVIMVDRNFKNIVAFGDLNDKGLSRLKSYLEGL